MKRAKPVHVVLSAVLGLSLLGFASISAAAPLAAVGGIWNPFSLTAGSITPPLYTVDGRTSSDVWAVGEGGGAYHYNGMGWSAIDSGVTFALESVAPIPDQPNMAVVVGENEGGANPALVLTCSLAGCTRDTTVPAVGRLDAVWVTSATDYWVVGGSTIPANGSILHFMNGTWSSNQVTGAVPNIHYHDVQMLSNGEGYAAGEATTTNGPGTLLHYTTATGWQPVDTGITFSGSLNGVWFISPQEGWVVGGNLGLSPVILHYNSSATPNWTSETVTSLPTQTLLWFVRMNADGSGYASGNGGQILYHEAGATTWQSVYTDPTYQPFYGLWLGASGVTGWAVGGTLLPTGSAITARLSMPVSWLPEVYR